ncbi:diadenylate cyclase CdaA [Kallipyga massiliensis]|uniref:diadenylate cyclase CdaA n=1 Tax=Kallipyga massiliensis TaxID=1472764 RepID=UPI0004BA22A2|nr:diadenylate cyclase CdaA [Kallipyga massiliensis]
MEILEKFRQLIVTFRWTDLVDILVIAVIIYYMILFVRETRALQLIKGFAALLILAQISEWFDLYTLNWLLSNIFTVSMVLIIVVFQPELRRVFERLGRSRRWLSFFINTEESESLDQVDEIVRASSSLARQKIGALMVIEGRVGLSDLLESGTRIDGQVTAELLINIFIPNTPLHDGAVIIRNDRVRAAGVFLPLTQNNSLSKELGTRHRAALGISEKSDALVVVVSEETGLISVCQEGEIARRLDEDSLRTRLQDFFTKDSTMINIGNLIEERREASHEETQE